MSKNKKSKSSVSALDLRQSLEGVTQWVVLFFLAVFPLLPGTNQVYVNITYSKFMYFLIATLVYIALVIFLVCRAYAKDKNVLKNMFVTVDADGNTVKWKPSLPQIFIVCYMLWSLISAIASKYPFSDTIIGSSRYEALLSIWLYGILFLLISMFGKHSDVYLYGLMVMAVIMGVICMAQSLGSTILYPGDYTYFNSSFLGTIGHHDCYSNIVSLIIPALFLSFVFLDGKFRWVAVPGMFTLFFVQIISDVDCGKIGLLAAFIVAMPFLLDSKKNILRTLQAGAVLILGYSFFCLLGQTKPNEAWTVTADKKFVVTLVAAIVLFAIGLALEKLWEKNKKEFKLSKKVIRLIIVAVLVICIVVVLMKVYKYQGEKKLIQEASMLMHGELSDEMGTGRGFIWKGCFEIIKENKVVGIGPGTFLAKTQEVGLKFPSAYIDQAHNDFIHIATCQGLVGLFIYLAFIISLIIIGLKKSIGFGRATIYTIGIIGFLGSVTFVFSIAIVSPVYWVFAGLLLHLCSKK